MGTREAKNLESEQAEESVVCLGRETGLDSLKGLVVSAKDAALVTAARDVHRKVVRRLCQLLNALVALDTVGDFFCEDVKAPLRREMEYWSNRVLALGLEDAKRQGNEREREAYHALSQLEEREERKSARKRK